MLQPAEVWQVYCRFGEMEENVQSHRDAGRAFIHGWASQARCKLCASSEKPQLPSYWRQKKSLLKARKLHNIIILHMRAHFLLWEEFIGPSLKAMRTVLTRPVQCYGNTASLSDPDT